MFCGSGSCWMWGVRGLLDAIAAWGQAGEKRGRMGSFPGWCTRLPTIKPWDGWPMCGFLAGKSAAGIQCPFFTPGSGKAQEGKISQIRRDSGGRWVDAGFAGPGQTAAFVRPCGHPRRGYSGGDDPGKRRTAHGTPVKGAGRAGLSRGFRGGASRCFQELEAEDPALRLEYYPQEKELDVCITGAIQQEILAELARSGMV